MTCNLIAGRLSVVCPQRDGNVRRRRVTGVTVVGVRGRLVAVEAHVGRGLPSLTLTGLPGAGVQDARDRIRPAVESAGLEFIVGMVVGVAV
jgi:Subunit ChlI of Mg-chelatase